ncbi:somatostatin receptor type 4-like [Symsagittifera roscoffensis]|uniref:somatostatin receptor type 4-like n=1 Tax=Symsagittifera roscoffensis TaxID=84072 RepID=UPI00307BE8DA
MLFTRIILPILFAIGMVANIGALVLIKRQWSRIKRHIVSYTLIHLAMSDILYLLVLGVISTETLMNKIISPLLCKPKFFFDVLSQHVSAWLIVMMSHERYQAMNSPYTYNSTYQTKNAMALLFVWISGCFVSAPIAIFTEAMEEPVPSLNAQGEGFGNFTILHCGSTWDPLWKSVYFSSLAVMECLVPVGLMVFFYYGVFKNFLRQIQNPRSALCHINQHRLSAVLGMIVICFIISYGPFYISQMVNEFHVFTKHRETLVYLSLVFQILTYVNSCINPILYSGFTKKFMLIKDLNEFSTQLNPPPACDGDDTGTKAPYVPSTSFELSNKLGSTCGA